ncbi:MAG: BamA/TamA family outer membrane protein [Gracilimonas sp.]
MLNHLPKPLLFVLFLFISPALLGQGFNSTNGRNHPELNWKVAETEHFLIMYPDRISGIEDQAAAIAEETYESLSHNLEVEFDYKIRIYLSDEDEVNNGFAVPFTKSYTDIWVNLNDYSEIWTGSEKWLRKVVAHELAHIFHFEAVKSPLGLFQYTFANPLPSFWTEGLAQYETEYWDSQRGDRWLRKAIFDDNMNYYSGQALEDGRLRYALGNSQLRYFTEKYGDSTLVDLLSHREKLLGLIDYHDFNAAFDEVVNGGYSSFYNDWRKHMNIYYNTVASQMERVDSLNGDPLNFPGNFYFDASVSPNDSLVAVLGYPSMKRPVKRLYIVNNDSTQSSTLIGEGGMNEDLSWAADNKRLIYSRTVRGENSSLLNDIFIYDLDTENEQQVTFSRRAKFPVFGPGQNEISYIVNESGTGNLFTRNLATGKETRFTNYSGDIQLLWTVWIEKRNSWLVHRFEEDGDRNLVLINKESGSEQILNNGDADNREPVISPDGDKVAYISLRDEVPNVFIYDLDADTESQFTQVFTGAEVFGWTSDHDSTGTEHLLIGASESRNRDQLYFISAERDFNVANISPPDDYASWRTKTPPSFLESQIESNSALIYDKYDYSSFRNLTHVTSFGLPYYEDSKDWGIFATTNWTEPLGKHTLVAGGWVSLPDPGGKSYGAISYLNNQLYPSIYFNLYRIPENGQFYGDEFLIEEHKGGDIQIKWPLDMFSGSYQNSSFSFRLRHYSTRPTDLGKFSNFSNIAIPEASSITDLELGFKVKKQRPWRDNPIHPLDGSGLKITLAGAENILGSARGFLTTDINAFTMFPLLGMNRLYIQTRLQAQWGNPLPQNYTGFSRYDNISVNVLEEVPLQFFGDNERVRGYRSFVAGSKTVFGSAEYRIPFLPSLQTEILGVLSLGSTSLALFTDAGVVYDGSSDSGDSGTISRWGAGAEIKNLITLLGVDFVHSVGFAQPANKLFGEEDQEIYYRVKTVIPF